MSDLETSRVGTPRAMTNGAGAVITALEDARVDIVFGLPGVHNLPLWSAFSASTIRVIGVRHEQAAAYAADGYARATGRPGVALVTTGPGAANAVAATGEAWASGSPVVVVATDIPTSLRRRGVYRGSLHEVRNQSGLFAEVTKRTFRARAAMDIAPVMRKAIAAAARPPSGPVYVEIPTNLLTQATEGVASAVVPREPVNGIDLGSVAHVADLIGSARRPVLWVGGGAVRAGAHTAVAALASRIAAPVLETYAARGIVAPEHPSWVGLPPHVPEAGSLWDDADLVVSIGSDLDGMMTQNWRMQQPSQLVVININGRDGTKNYSGDVLESDARVACELLAQAIPARSTTAERVWGLSARREKALARVAAEDPVATRFLDALATGLPTDTVVCADMCIPGYWAAAFHPFPAPRRLAYPVGWGTLGFAFPASIGAALGQVGPTLCICGDGGFLFGVGELATVAQERIPLTALLVDDGGYGMLRFDQERNGGQSFGLDLVTPDWPSLAGSFGLPAETVTDVDALGRVLHRHVSDPAPSLIVLHAAMSPPPTTSPRWYRAGERENMDGRELERGN